MLIQASPYELALTPPKVLQSAKSVSEERNIPRANACLTPTQKSETLLNDSPQKFTISAASQIKNII